MKVVILAEAGAPRLFRGIEPVLIRTLAELEAHRDAELYIDLDFEKLWLTGRDGPAASRADALNRLLPSPVIVNAVVPTIGELGLPVIRLNGWPGFAGRDVHELSFPNADAERRLSLLYARLGQLFRPAPDWPGMISARILATVINEAWYTWEQGVSSKEEIDTAMKLGTNYPLGPFEWGAQIGLENVLSLLEALARVNPRYLPAKSLKNAVGKIKI
ncbi:MAG TPA: 3-hydroxyacyl-CoA dehydrogenase family protein [Puia sp.]|nr:3-hydroxyacyl-CoA dehydrogenase family protein [Puia sp.]